MEEYALNFEQIIVIGGSIKRERFDSCAAWKYYFQPEDKPSDINARLNHELPDNSVYIWHPFDQYAVTILEEYGFDRGKLTLIFGGFVDFYIDCEDLAWLMA